MNTNETKPDIHVGFSVQQRVARPLREVFGAVVDPEKLCRFFTKTASGPVVAGATLSWTWHSGGSGQANVEDLTEDESIVFRWKAFQVDDTTTCSFEFVPDGDDATLVRITEFGWSPNQESLESSYEHVNGWTHMLLCLKAWLEHGIDLRVTTTSE